MPKELNQLEDLRNLTAAGRAVEAQDWSNVVSHLHKLHIPEVDSALTELRPQDSTHAYYLALTTPRGRVLRSFLHELLSSQDSTALRDILKKYKGNLPESFHFEPAPFSQADIRKRKSMLQAWQRNLLDIDREPVFGTSRLLDKLFSALTQEDIRAAWEPYVKSVNDDLSSPLIYLGLYSVVDTALRDSDFTAPGFRQKLLDALRTIPGLEGYAIRYSAPSRTEAGESLSYAKLQPEEAKIKHAIDQLLEAHTLSQGVSALDNLSASAGITDTSPLFEALLYELEANANPSSGALGSDLRPKLLQLLSTVPSMKQIVQAYPEYGQAGQVHYSPELESTIARLGRKLEQLDIILKSAQDNKIDFDEARAYMFKTIAAFTGSRNVRGLFKGLTLKPFEDLFDDTLVSTDVDQLLEIRKKLDNYFEVLSGHKVGTPGIIKNLYEKKRKELEEQKSRFAIPTSQDLAKTFLNPEVEKAYARWAEANPNDTSLYALTLAPSGFLPKTDDSSPEATIIREAYRQLVYAVNAQSEALDDYKKNRLGRELSKETPEIRERIDTALQEYKENALRRMFPSGVPQPDLFLENDSSVVQNMSNKFYQLQLELGLKQRSETGEGGSYDDEDRRENQQE